MRRLLPFFVVCVACPAWSAAHAQHDIVIHGGGGGAPDTVLPPRPAESTAAPTPSTAKPNPNSVGNASTAGTANTGGVESPGALELDWDVWWHFHQHEFLGLRDRVHAGRLVPREFEGDAALAASFARAPAPTQAEIESAAEPRLTQLVREGSTELAAGALIGLARLGLRSGRVEPPAAIQGIVARVASPARGIAESAVLALGILGDEAGLATLAALLADDEAGRKLANLPAVPYRMRSFAAYGLGLIGHATGSNRTRQFVCRALTGALGATLPPATDTQVACLIALGMTPLDSDAQGSRAAPWISRQTQLEFLERLAASEESGRLLRAHACAALARLASSAESELRSRSARTLLAWLARDSVDALVREACIFGLGELVDVASTQADGAGAEALFALLDSGSRGDADAARMALVSLAGRCASTRVNEVLLRRLRERLLADTSAPAARKRAWSAFALGVLEARRMHAGQPGSPAVQAALRALWKRDTSPDVRSACALALGLARDVEAASLLGECLARGGDDALRGYCALGLGLCGRSADAAFLRGILRESTQRPYVLESAAIALGLLGEKAVVEDLLAGLEASLSQTSQGWFALAIGHVGDVRALPVLLERMQDEKLSRRSRAYLAVALGMICESAALPWAQPIAADLAWRATSETLYSGAGQGVLELL